MAAMLSSKVALPRAFTAAKPASRSAKVQAVQAKTTSGKAKTVKGATSPAPKSDLTEGQQYTLTLPGISAPFADPYFDPAGFTKTAKPRDIKRWRESEVTHGRVAMLAALGFIVGENLEDFPAFLNFDGNITGPAIYQFQKVEEVRPLFWEVLVVAIGLAESYRVSVGWATPTGTGFNALKDDYEPGTLGFDPLGLLKDKSPEEIFELETKELNNGRLAMISIAGFVLQELVPPHREIFEHLFLEIEREAILEIEDLDPALNIPVPVIPGL